MLTTWHEITQSLELGFAMPVGQILAQSPTLTDGTGDPVQGAIQQVVQFLPRLLAAVGILIIGWLIAAIAAAIVRGVLNRTKIDNRIAANITGGQETIQVEKIISGVVFWSVLLLAIVAVLDTLELRVASQPLNRFLNQIGEFLPKLLAVGILLGAAWAVATVVRIITVRGFDALRIDERLNGPNDSTSPLGGMSLSQTIGNALYWFIFLLFLVPVLDTLGLQLALQPVQNMVTEILAILPNILAATIIGVVGWFAANVIRRIVVNLLSSTGFDHIGSRFGLSAAAGMQSLSAIIGTIVYILVLIPVAIAALSALQIQAISQPAIAMLQQVLNALPLIFTAGAILTIAYFFARFIAELVTNILTSIGFNNIFSVLGLSSLQANTNQPPSVSSLPRRTPSEIAGIITLVGIMLFAAVAAVDILKIPALTSLVNGILVVMGRILAGLVVFGIGLFLANFAFSIITSSGSSQARILGQVARIAIVTLVSAMALQQIGVAPDIVNLAFGLLLGAIAVAIALAFGLGGRDVARGQLQEWLDSFKSRS